MPISAILFTRHGGRPIKHKRVISGDARGSVARMQGDGFAKRSGWNHGGGRVALLTITTRALM